MHNVTGSFRWEREREREREQQFRNEIGFQKIESRVDLQKKNPRSLLKILQNKRPVKSKIDRKTLRERDRERD